MWCSAVDNILRWLTQKLMLNKNNCNIFCTRILLLRDFSTQLFDLKKKHHYVYERLKRQMFGCPLALIDDVPVQLFFWQKYFFCINGLNNIIYILDTHY